MKLIRTASTYVKDIEPKCKCGNYAVCLFEAHRWDDCFEGDDIMASFMCAGCRGEALQRLDRICEAGGDICVCGLRLVTPSDIIVRITPLTSGK